MCKITKGDSFIRMKAEEIKELAQRKLDSIAESREKLLEGVVERELASSRWWRRVLVLPALLESMGWLNPLTTEQVVQNLSIYDDIAVNMTYGLQESICNKLIRLSEHSKSVVVSGEDLRYVTT